MFCRTSTDHELIVNGEAYSPSDGITPSSISGTADGAVQNSDVAGFLTDFGISEAEIEAGIWDQAEATLFEVNWAALSQGRMTLQTGTLGNLSTGRIAYSGEIRGLSQALQQTIGRVYGPTCQATLGDSECKVPVESMRVYGTFTAVTTRRDMTDSARTEVPDWFGAGVIRVESGSMTGAEMEIHSYQSGRFVLVLPFPFNPEIGMSYSAIPGCRKRHERGIRNPSGVSDCKDKFNNVINFRGFPPSQFPGNNRILGLGSNTK